MKFEDTEERYVKSLFLLCYEDLKVAQLLNSNGHYSNALYHFIQSVEKFIKTIGLVFELVNIKELSGSAISHNYEKIIDRWIDDVERIPVFTYFSKYIELSIFRSKSFKSNSNNTSEILLIKNLLREFESSGKVFDNFEKMILQNSFFADATVVEFFNELQREVPIFQNLTIPNKIRRLTPNELRELLLEVIENLKILNGPKLCTAFSLKFEQDYLRYPSNDGRCPLDKFSIGKPVPENLKFFLDILAISIKKFDKNY